MKARTARNGKEKYSIVSPWVRRYSDSTIRVFNQATVEQVAEVKLKHSNYRLLGRKKNHFIRAAETHGLSHTTRRAADIDGEGWSAVKQEGRADLARIEKEMDPSQLDRFFHESFRTAKGVEYKPMSDGGSICATTGRSHIEKGINGGTAAKKGGGLKQINTMRRQAGKVGQMVGTARAYAVPAAALGAKAVNALHSVDQARPRHESTLQLSQELSQLRAGSLFDNESTNIRYN